MAETINMPKLGFDMAEGTLVRWVKQVGETINKGDVLAEIETDKATVEVESPASGVVRRLLVDEGAVVPVSSPIAIVGTADEKLEEVAAQSAPPLKAAGPVALQAAKPAPIPIPTATPPAPISSVIGIPNRVPFGDQQSTISNLRSEIPRASPLAKNIALEHHVDLSQVHGTGPGGRIVRRDVEAALLSQESPVSAQIAFSPSTSDDSTMRLVDQVVPLSKLRAAIARRMAESKTSIPHFYVTHEYKVDSLLDLRRQLNNMQPEDGKVSVNDFIVKAVALTLRQFPNLNASLSGTSVVRHAAINIGIAVAVEGGLLTVVCREADRKSLRQISAEVKGMAVHVREGKVRSEEIEGSTFSISNMGMYEVENFAAIINPPEAAILAVGTAHEVPVVEDGLVKAGWRMKATISVDHRVSDGVEAAKFMQALAVYLEEPVRLVV